MIRRRGARSMLRRVIASGATLLLWACAAPAPVAPAGSDPTPLQVEGAGLESVSQTWIAFVATSKGLHGTLFQLVIAHPTGESRRVVAQSREPLMSPSWSPDGQKLAYVGYDHGQSAIYVQELVSGALKRVVAEPGINGAPAWSPDGAKMAVTLSFRTNPDVYIIDLASGARQRITEGPAIDTEAAWSPDGKELAFVSDRSGPVSVYLQNLAGGGPPVAVQVPYVRTEEPRYSPDGGTLVMTVSKPDSGYHIALLDQQSGTFQVLTDGALDQHASFSPDGKLLVYGAQEAGQSAVLHIIDRDGKRHVTLGDVNGDLRDPAWSPR